MLVFSRCAARRGAVLWSLRGGANEPSRRAKLRDWHLGTHSKIAKNTQHWSLSRAAGRVIENPLVSVTIDVLMMRIPSCRANGSDRGNGVGGKVGDYSLSANVFPQRLGARVWAPTFFSTPFSQSTPLALKFGEHFMSRSMVTLLKGSSMTRPSSR